MRGTDLDLLDDSKFVTTLYLGAMIPRKDTDSVGSTSVLGTTDVGTRVGSPGKSEVGGDGGHLNFRSIRIGKAPKV